MLLTKIFAEQGIQQIENFELVILFQKGSQEAYHLDSSKSDQIVFGPDPQANLNDQRVHISEVEDIQILQQPLNFAIQIPAELVIQKQLYDYLKEGVQVLLIGYLEKLDFLGTNYF